MKIKLCGLMREADALYANEAAPDYVGFIFAPGRRRTVSLEQALRIKSHLNPEIRSVGVFFNQSEREIGKIAQTGVIDVVQLHGEESMRTALRCRDFLPVIKAVSMTKSNAEEQLALWSCSKVDFLLLDSGRGGTGMRFDYARIRTRQKPFFLAGGLDVGNVTEAIRIVRPFGVDVSSGVETDGSKDRQKMIEIVRRIRNESR